NHDGTLHSSPVGLFHDGTGPAFDAGPPAVADFDGDGKPEIAFEINYRAQAASIDNGSRDILYVYEFDGTPRWHRDLSPIGAFPDLQPVSAFDFDGDGAAEVVYQDAQYLYVLDGRDGSVRLRHAITNLSMTVSTDPVIADVDNDGAAEIVATVDGRFPAGSG